MTLPVPPTLEAPAYAPLVRLLRDVLISPIELANRWGYIVGHLNKLRHENRGVPWVKLPTGPVNGGIRYRLSDIIAAELAGAAGPVTIERVCMVVAACHELAPEQRVAVIARLREALPA